MADIDAVLERAESETHRLAVGSDRLPRRWAYYRIASLVFGRKAKTIVLFGLRGVGKTVILHQLAAEAISKGLRPIYLRGDRLSLLSINPLHVLEAAAARYDVLLVDEAHYIPRWSAVAKVVHDGFSTPAIYTGSATIDYTLSADLARRAVKEEVFPLPFPEHIMVVRRQRVPSLTGLRDAFLRLDAEALSAWEERLSRYRRFLHEYVERGGFAFFSETGYLQRVRENIFERAVFSDLVGAGRFEISTAEKVRRTIALLASHRPGGVSLSKIAQVVGGRSMAYTVLRILEMLRIAVPVYAWSGSPAVSQRKDPRIYFTTQAVYTAVREEMGMDPDLGVLRETGVFGVLWRLTRKFGGGVFYPRGARKSPDFVLQVLGRQYFIEVGGASKTAAQLRGFKGARVVVRDDGGVDVRGSTLYIPLWLLLFVS